MIVEIIAIILTGALAWQGHEQLIKDKLDTPRNNEAVKGLEKSEIRAKIKEDEAAKKAKEKEIKDLEKERKDILKTDAEDKAEQAQEILEAKEELAKEVKELETNLKDLKTVNKGGYWVYAPNKLNFNNGLWGGGSLLGLFLFYQLCVGILSRTLPKNWTQSNNF